MKPGSAARRPSIDWEAAQARLDRARRTAEETVELSAERARALMEDRARALARPVQTTPAVGETAELLSFELAGERFAIETRHVQAVLELPGVTPVPGTPRWIAGVTVVRGEILPVVDLWAMLDRADAQFPERRWLVVVGGDQPDLGLLASAAGELRDVPTSEFVDPPADLAAGLPVLAVTRDGLVVLDGRALSDDPRLVLDHGEGARG